MQQQQKLKLCEKKTCCLCCKLKTSIIIIGYLMISLGCLIMELYFTPVKSYVGLIGTVLVLVMGGLLILGLFFDSWILLFCVLIGYTISDVLIFISYIINLPKVNEEQDEEKAWYKAVMTIVGFVSVCFMGYMWGVLLTYILQMRRRIVELKSGSSWVY